MYHNIELSEATASQALQVMMDALFPLSNDTTAISTVNTDYGLVSYIIDDNHMLKCVRLFTNSGLVIVLRLTKETELKASKTIKNRKVRDAIVEAVQANDFIMEISSNMKLRYSWYPSLEALTSATEKGLQPWN